MIKKALKAVSDHSLKQITYQKLFWLFMAGSLIRVVIEGLWCFVRYGQWETHVVSIWGPFCIIYGIGVVGLYIGSVALQNKTGFGFFAFL